MNTNEVLKLALEALEYIHEGANNQGPHTGISWRCVSNKAESAITALREALAEPQEKYIYGTPLLDAMTGKANEALDKKAENARELGLDYEPVSENFMDALKFDVAMREALAEHQAQGCEYCNHPLYAGTKCKNCGRVTEQAAIKQDLTPEQPAQQERPSFAEWTNDYVRDNLHKLKPPQQQEPVTWDNCRSEKQCRSWCGNSACGSHWNDTSPPAQRKPLTDEEISAEVEKELTHYWNGEYIDTTGARDHLTAFARAIEAAHGIKEN